jgi:hypothetical protein
MIRKPLVADRDWWTPHAAIAMFVPPVTAILRAVPGGSAPLPVRITPPALESAR